MTTGKWVGTKKVSAHFFLMGSFWDVIDAIVEITEES